MNYGLALALRMEEILEELMADGARVAELGIDLSDPYIDEESALASKALELAVEETHGEAWAAGGKSLRIGEIILLVDSDTQVPEVRPSPSVPPTLQLNVADPLFLLRIACATPHASSPSRPRWPSCSTVPTCCRSRTITSRTSPRTSRAASTRRSPWRARTATSLHS